MQNEKSRALRDAVTKDFNHSFRDPLWKDIPMDGGLRRLYLEPAVQKLDRIRQNGPACHIYPGAVHTRLVHSLGVYNTGRLIILSLLREDQPGLTPGGVRSFLCACLLHDIGHFPYAHSLKELPLREHEKLAGDLIDNVSTLSEAIREAGGEPAQVKAIIDKELTADEETEIYRNILSGALDPDKLDYLNRDAFFAGVPYGLQDNGYIISSMRLRNGRICLDREALASLEHLLFSKYLMYRNVYWHKGVRSATSMIKKALLMGIRDGVIKPEDLYFLDDHDFDRIPGSRPSYQPFELITRVADNQLLSKIWEKPHEPGGEIETECADLFDRLEVESRLFARLRSRYRELKPWEVVIDIQEPVSFESDTGIIMEDGSITPFNDATKVFTSDVGRQFGRSLRTVTVFAPSYVDSALVREEIRGSLR